MKDSQKMKTISWLFPVLAIFIFAYPTNDELWSVGFWIKTMVGFIFLLISIIIVVRSIIKRK